MRYFIDNPMTYASVNNKGVEMNKWVRTFKHFILPNQLSLDAFLEEIRLTAKALDEDFPRSTPLHVDIIDSSGGKHVQVYPVEHPEKSVFTLSIYPIRGEFRFSEPSAQYLPEPEKGGPHGNA